MNTDKTSQKLEIATKLLSYKVANRNLIRFCEVLEPDPNDPNNILKSHYDAQSFHKVLANILERVENGEEKRIIITFPPRHGKTELASKKFPSWLIGRNPRSHVIFATYNQTLADDNGKAVRDNMRSPTYVKIFPEVELKKGSQSVKRLETKQGGVLVFVGREGTITGRGGDLIVLDDLLKNRKDADSLTTRNTVWNWFKGTVLNRFMSDKGAMLIITTRWHEDDIVGRLTDPRNPEYNAKEASKWKIINFTGLAEEDDILGREVGEALWPSKFGVDYLLSYKNISPRDFSALYQQRPSPEEGNLFTEQMFQTFVPSDLPSNLRIYAASDHAVSIGQENDKTCLLIVGVDSHDVIWILDIVWKKIKSDVAVDKMVGLMKKWKPITWWGEPGQLAKAIGPFLRKRMREEKVYVNIKEISASGDKYTKAQSFFGRMSMGMVRWPKYAYWLDDAKLEFLTFPSGVNDDFVDTCSLIGLGLHKMLTGSKTKEKEKGPQVGSLAWVKQDSKHRSEQEKRQNRLKGW